MSGQKIKILGMATMIDGKMVADKNFKPHNMIMNSYKREDFGYDEDDDEIVEAAKPNSKNIFIQPTPKKIKFTKEIVGKLMFGSVSKLLDVKDGNEAYLGAYSEPEFLSYMYHKKHGFYPDLVRFQSIKTDKFLKELFKYCVLPLDSYVKSFEDSAGEAKLNTIIFVFNVDGSDDMVLHMDQDEAMIFYNRAYENNPNSQFHILMGLIKSCTEPKVTKNKIYVVYSTQHGFEKMGFSVKKVGVDIEENYNDGFHEISKEIIDGLNNKKKTNLVILSGDPGTGKTTFLRYLTSKIKKNIIFISPDMVNQITDPAFIPFLIRNNDTVLIIEDAEPALQSRDGNGRTGAVSNVLNLTDGLLSDCLNISIIATFNTSGKDIDKALLRKGRLLKNYKFEKLCIEKSKALLKKLGHNEVEVKEPMALSDIYFYEQDNNITEYKSKKIGFGN